MYAEITSCVINNGHSVSVSFIHSNQRDVGTWGTMHELVIT